jgi:hypothetical protein
MYNGNAHIISKFRWNTFFDSKEQAFSLQERLSDWSRIHLERETSSVFNQLCPPEQNWKIGLLELDLGTIDFYNLERDLTEKIGKCLKAALIDQIIGTGNDNSNIEISTREFSSLTILQTYFNSGVFPWNTKSTDVSVNNLLSELFNNEDRDLRDWIIELGATSLEIRKRMAMQISEPNLVRLLKIIEPTNHQQIIEFTDELTNLQEKEPFIQTSAKDFRKHLWFWTFNFLFTERGSVFNKKSYLKSSIRQMSDHFNIAYESLFLIIAEASEKVSKHLGRQVDFLLILQELTKEYKAGISMNIFNDSQTNDWKILEQLLIGNAVTGYSRENTINEFIISLYRKDNHLFRKLIQSLQLSQSKWLSMVELLNENSRELVLNAFDPGRACFVISSIHFLIKLSKANQISAHQNLLWVTGIRNLRQKNNDAQGNRLFMMDCILSLAKSNGVSWEKMLLQLVGTPIPASCKTGKALDVFGSIGDIFFEEIWNRPPTFFNNRFIELVDSYYDHLDHNKMDTEKMVSVQLSLRKYMQLYPSVALELLVQHSGKDKFSKLFDNLIDNHLAAILLEHAAAGSYFSLLASINKQFKKFGDNHFPVQLNQFFENHLMHIGLRLIVMSPELERIQFLDKLFKELFSVIPFSLNHQFKQFLTILVSGESAQLLGLPSKLVEKFRILVDTESKVSVLERLNLLMIEGTHNKEVVSKILRSNFKDPAFVRVRNSNRAAAILIANYIVGGAGTIMDHLIDEYVTNMKIQEISIINEAFKERMRELFWKCLLDMNLHHGSLKKFINTISKSIHLVYPVEEKFVQSIKTADPLQNELLGLIKQCFENGDVSIVYQGRIMSLRELIRIAVEIVPRELVKITSQLLNADKHVELLGSVLSFQDLSICMVDLGEETFSSAIEDMRFLLFLANASANETKDEQWETKMIRQLFSLLANGNWGLSAICQEILNMGISAQQISEAIIEIRYQPSLVLQSLLIKQMPSLADQLYPVAGKNSRNRLQEIVKKGILEQLIQSILQHQQVPFWYANDEVEEAGSILVDIITYYPLYIKKVLKQESISHNQLRWLALSIDTKELFRAFKRLNIGKSLLINDFSILYAALENISLKGIPGYELQALFFRKIISVWITENWETLSANQIWNTLAWECAIHTGLAKNNFVSGIEKYRLRLPVSLQVSFEQFKESLTPLSVFQKSKPSSMQLQKPRFCNVAKPGIGEGIAIKNAGLVLLNSYIPLLFERLELIRDGEFIQPNAQNDAVHFLQYLVTGAEATEEFLLPLNKILCGMDLGNPITDGVSLNEDQAEMMESLIHGVISHWPDSGSQSVDGLRGNWLVRNGILRKEENGWELTVERKAYDLLLMRVPFSFSVIKFPWMPKPLTVKWRL